MAMVIRVPGYGRVLTSYKQVHEQVRMSTRCVCATQAMPMVCVPTAVCAMDCTFFLKKVGTKYLVQAVYRSGDPFPTPWDKSSSSWTADVLRLDPVLQEGRTDASPVERALKPDPQVPILSRRRPVSNQGFLVRRPLSDPRAPPVCTINF